MRGRSAARRQAARLRRADRRGTRRARRGTAALLHRRAGSDRALRPARNRGRPRRSRSRRCGRPRIISWRGLPASAIAMPRSGSRNLELYVPRERLPAPERGRRVLSRRPDRPRGRRPRRRKLGTVVAIHNFGAGDLIEVRPTQAARPSWCRSTTPPCRRSMSPPGALSSIRRPETLGRWRLTCGAPPCSPSSRRCSRARSAKPRRQGARQRRVGARCRRHPRVRDRQAPHRRRHAGGRRPRHGDEGRRARARARCRAAGRAALAC